MSESSEQTAGLRNLHGRQLNTMNEVGDTKKEYMLPADAPEMKRLNTQHKMMVLAMGGLYPDNYADIIRRRLEPREGQVIEIADLGSGSGDWISDMAKEFPHVQAIGIDLAPSIPNEVAPNVRFVTRDVTQNMEEYNGRFDVVQARSIANGVLDYPAFITSKFYAKLFTKKLPGFLQFYDQELNRIEPNGGITKLLAEIVSRQPNPNKQKLNKIGDSLEDWMQQNNELKDVKANIIYVPVGWEGSLEYCKEPVAAGRLMMDNTKAKFCGSLDSNVPVNGSTRGGCEKMDFGCEK
ncbi:methyltransferase domain protein [Ceratobasidium sp. AG-Ba]|nr:methyltransferase domain protein [Ceratobasidium sp. AG-Ba]